MGRYQRMNTSPTHRSSGGSPSGSGGSPTLVRPWASEEAESWDLAELDRVPTEQREQAARCIQRCARSFKSRRMFPSMDKLRALFMDEKAIQAGAKESKWYQPAALAIRESLRSAPEVVGALSDAWEACAAASSSPQGLTFPVYSVMCRKMYLAAKLEDAEGQVDPEECMEHMKEDWEEDTDGADLLTEPLFNRCTLLPARRAPTNMHASSGLQLRTQVGSSSRTSTWTPSVPTSTPNGCATQSA